MTFDVRDARITGSRTVMGYYVRCIKDNIGVSIFFMNKKSNSAKKIQTMKTKQILVIFIALMASYALQAQTSGSFTDTRDGQTYKTVQIGEQVWIAENLNYKTRRGSWCYDNDAANCEKYGMLYNWKTAKTVCPPGWELPSFGTLLSNVGGRGSNAYNALIPSGNRGFSALFGGWRNHYGDFLSIDRSGAFWSSSPGGISGAWSLSISSGRESAFLSKGHRSGGYSVRCIKK